MRETMDRDQKRYAMVWPWCEEYEVLGCSLLEIDVERRLRESFQQEGLNQESAAQFAGV